MYEELDVAEERAPGPSIWDSVTELPRVMLELGSLVSAWPLLARAPRGDGHAVMVLPGFTAGDESTVVLRRFLSRLDYHALPWQLGQNNGSFELQDRLLKNFRTSVQNFEGRISLIGQSLGGVFARILAYEFPDNVRQVITLGSPFASSSPSTTNPVVGRLFQYMSGMTRDEMRLQMTNLPQYAPPVPCTAIYSKADGVVHWSSCLEYEGAQSENVEIYGSHSGMALNPAVFHVIADRLAQPENGWQPFHRGRGCRPLLYPKPEQLR